MLWCLFSNYFSWTFVNSESCGWQPLFILADCFTKRMTCSVQSIWGRYGFIPILPGHKATINLHLSLTAPSHWVQSFRVLLAALNNSQNAAGPCQPVLICGCRPRVELSRCWLLDLLYSVGGLATSFSLHAGKQQWADTRAAITQRDGPARTNTHTPMYGEMHGARFGPKSKERQVMWRSAALNRTWEKERESKGKGNCRTVGLRFCASQQVSVCIVYTAQVSA